MNRLLTAAHRHPAQLRADLEARNVRILGTFDDALARMRTMLADARSPANRTRAGESGAAVFGAEHVLTGNADIAEDFDWLGPIDARLIAPLPGHEHSAALATIERVPA